MLTGIRVYSSDATWRQILAELNATVTNAPCLTDVNLDSLNLELPISPVALKSVIMNAMDTSDVIAQILGPDANLPRLPAQIVAWLYRTGGMSSADLKVALGYASDATTHTVDTAICGLRRRYGREFIINDNGVYRLGRV